MYTLLGMKGFYLSPEELSSLHVAHRDQLKSRNPHGAYKINAVILLGTGWTLTKVKEALLFDDETLRSYVEKYKTSGVAGLIKTNYKGSKGKLNDSQIDLLKSELDNNIYLTTVSVIEYVESEFGVIYSVTGMRDLLHRLGFEYKKPKLVPGNPDIDAQEIFVEQYEAFMAEKPGDVEVLFVDAVHPEHNTMAAYGWIKKGKKKELKSNSGRDRLNLHGALNAETLDVTIIESATVDSDSTIDLIQVLDQKYALSSKIILILDNARYHFSKEVQKALKDHPRIQFVFLPSYSPNLNLIERLWKFFKKKVLYNRYHKSLGAFRKASIDFFRNIERYSDELASIMSGGFEISYT